MSDTKDLLEQEFEIQSQRKIIDRYKDLTKILRARYTRLIEALQAIKYERDIAPKVMVIFDDDTTDTRPVMDTEIVDDRLKDVEDLIKEKGSE